MNRLPMPGAMPAELAERQSDQSVDVTDADEDEAITAIVEDYLLDGRQWPRSGRRTVTAGDVLMDWMDAELLENLLTAITDGGEERILNARERARDIVKLHASTYLRTHYPDLIETMLEQIRGDNDRSDDHD